MIDINFHGKVTKEARLVLVNIDGEQTPVAVFTVADIGTPFEKKNDPVFLQVNYKRESASVIYNSLKPGKEVFIHGTITAKYKKNKHGERMQHLYLKADNVILLPMLQKQDGV